MKNFGYNRKRFFCHSFRNLLDGELDAYLEVRYALYFLYLRA